MIDMHLHLLPGVDDGPDSVEESDAMLAILASMGFDRLVVTPHLMEPLADKYHQTALAAINAVSPLAANQGIALALGFEHVLSPGLVRRLRDGEPSTLAGSHAVLVELPFMHWPADTAHNLFTLREAGYRPVLAHPERYLDAVKSPQLVLDAVTHGAVPQITTGSLAGLYGVDALRLSRYLVNACLDQDLPFALSSDAHSSGRRLTSVADGLAWLRGNLEYGEQVVEWSATVVPTQLVSDIPPVPFRAWLANAHPEIGIPSPEAYLTGDWDQKESGSERRGLSRLFRGRGA